MSSSNKPNPLAPKEEKLTNSYGCQYGKYIQSKAIGNDFSYYDKQRDRIREARAYAQGNQNNDRYKQLLNATGDNSMVNLNFTPLGIGAKFVNSLVDDILQDFHVNVEAIDPASLSKRNKEKEKILGNFYDKDFIEEFREETGIDIADGEFIPDSLEEVDLHMNINFKQSVEIAMQQAINFTLEMNDYPDEVRRMLCYDLVTAGKAAAEVYLDPNYGIVTNHVDIENFVCSESKKSDHSDIEWGAEFKWMTAADIRRLAPDEDISDGDMEDICQKFQSRYGNGQYTDAYTEYSNTNKHELYNYRYDSLVVPVLKFRFKSVDRDKIKVTKSKYGERRYIKKDTYQPDGKTTNVKVEEDTYETVYGGYYILGTDYVFNYGCIKNLVRPKDDLQKVELPYKVYAPQFYNMSNKSLVELIMPYIDMINLAHLKMQQTVAKSKPEVTTIDIEGMMNFTMGGKDWTPLELQDVYDAYGIIYHKSRDEEDNFIQTPIQHFPYRMDISGHVETINIYTDLIYKTLGFTPEREGITANKQLVGTMELSIASSRNATNHISRALDNITKRVLQDVAWRIQDFEKGSKFYKIYEEAIGMADMGVVHAMGDIASANFGIFPKTRQDNEERIALERDIERSLTQKELRPEDASMIRSLAKTTSIDNAYQYMKVRRKQYQKELMAMEEQRKQIEAQAQIQVQQASAQAKAQEQQGEAQLVQLKQQTDSQGNIAKLREEYRLKSLLSEQEHEQAMELEGAQEQGQMARERFKETAKDDRIGIQAKAQAKKDEQVAKVKDGTKSAVDTDRISDEEDVEELLREA